MLRIGGGGRRLLDVLARVRFASHSRLIVAEQRNDAMGQKQKNNASLAIMLGGVRRAFAWC